MIPPSDTIPAPPSPSSNFGQKKRKAVPFIILIVLVLCSAWAIHHFSKTEEPHQIPVFSGISNHPDQNTVPVSMKCGACHEDIFRQWADSDHAWAHRDLNPKLDAAPFHDLPLSAHGSTVSFSTNEQGERILSDKKSGKSWKMDMAIGRVPLVQYLTKGAHGGYHTTSAAWDTQKKEWFDMFGNDYREPGDWGHWTGRGMVWNSQCAWCHMTHFRKKYDVTTHSYHSTWKEPGVTCIQCHGPVLNNPEATTGCLVRTNKKDSIKQMADNCASCHARRDELDDKFKMGDKFEDHFVLVLPTQPGLYWPNGMQRDEVYTETGLKLSRMGKAGVQCLDCHNAHSGKLKYPADDNSLCLQCHEKGDRKAPIITPLEHSRHKQGSTGNKCVECHMPESPYMARDPRRDHSFNSPDPVMSKELGIPNSCIMCHVDQNNDWAIKYVKEWYGDLPLTSRRERTRAVDKALKGDSHALPELLSALKKEENPTWKATLLDLMEPWASYPQVVTTAVQAVDSPHSLERVAAAKILGHTRNQAMLPLLTDPVKSVRIQAGWSLREMIPQNAPLMKELEAVARHQADQPGGAMKLAQIYSTRANQEGLTEQEREKWNTKALYWFTKAKEWDPTSSVIRRDFAIFLASLDKPNEAVTEMETAIKLEPGNPDLYYLLSLALTETNKIKEALAALTKALEIAPDFGRAAYSRAVIKHQAGDTLGAISDMDIAIKAEPDNLDYVYYKSIYLRMAGKEKEADLLIQELRKKDSRYPLSNS